jgi:hypothetical protein
MVLTVGPAAAQDARAVLQAASKAMGNLKSVQITGTGWNAAVGQSFTSEEDWPRFQVTRYVRTIDYEAGTSREEFTRQQGNYPRAAAAPRSRVNSSRSSSSAGTVPGTFRMESRFPSRGSTSRGFRLPSSVSWTSS